MRPDLSAKQIKTKDAYLLRNYHINYEFYCKLRDHQNYRCGICKTPENMFKHAMAVDHDHITGEVRGLLCWKCNRALGKFQDSTERIQAAAAYVTTPPVQVLNFNQKIYTTPGKVGTQVRAKLQAKSEGKKWVRRKRKATRKKRIVKRSKT